MFGGLNRLLAVTAVAGVALVVLVTPSAALACDGGPSAVNVYKECLPSGGGNSGGGATSTTGTGSTPAISNQASRALAHAGKDRRVLAALVHDYARHRSLQAAHAAEAGSEPSALGSAFDLGSGPTALLIALGCTALLLLGGSGMRVWRSRHRP